MIRNICFVDTTFHMDGVPRVPLLSEESVAEYDLVVIDWRQSFRGWLTHDAKLNRSIIPSIRTKKYWDCVRLRANDMMALASRGATVTCILGPVEEYLDSNHGKVSSLDWLPQKLFRAPKVESSYRCAFRPINGGPFNELVKSYLKHFECNAVFTGSAGSPFLIDNDSGGIAATSAPFGRGYIVFIPSFSRSIEDRLSSSAYTAEDSRFVRSFMETTMSAVKMLQESGNQAAPDWVEEIILPSDAGILDQISAREKEIERLKSEIAQLRTKLGSSRDWKKLLYDKEEGVSEAVSKSLELLGFEPASPTSANATVDGFFKAAEGYLLVKTKGTDNTPIEKDTLLDLFRQTAEELAVREEEIASVLVGNAYRLTPPEKRSEQFSKSVQKIARSHNLGLMTSEELYRAVGYVLAHPDDEEFKALCRKALLGKRGEEIRFEIPKS